MATEPHVDPVWATTAGRVAYRTVLFVFVPLFVAGSVGSLLVDGWPSDEPTGTTLVFTVALMASVAVTLLAGAVWLVGRIPVRPKRDHPRRR